jgi:hypothetical protein
LTCEFFGGETMALAPNREADIGWVLINIRFRV